MTVATCTDTVSIGIVAYGLSDTQHTSSSNNRLGFTNKAAPKAALMAQPPLSIPVGLSILANVNPNPVKIFLARASAVDAPMASNRS